MGGSCQQLTPPYVPWRKGRSPKTMSRSSPMVTLEQGKQTWEKGSQKKNHLEIVGLPSQHGFEKSIDTKLNSRNERNIELKLCF